MAAARVAFQPQLGVAGASALGNDVFAKPSVDLAQVELADGRSEPHEARHCAASYFIAAGLNAKQLSVYIGHSDIRTTYNRYGHLMPGDEREAAHRLDMYLSGGSSLA